MTVKESPVPAEGRMVLPREEAPEPNPPEKKKTGQQAAPRGLPPLPGQDPQTPSKGLTFPKRRRRWTRGASHPQASETLSQRCLGSLEDRERRSAHCGRVHSLSSLSIPSVRNGCRYRVEEHQ